MTSGRTENRQAVVVTGEAFREKCHQLLPDLQDVGVSLLVYDTLVRWIDPDDAVVVDAAWTDSKAVSGVLHVLTARHLISAQLSNCASSTTDDAMISVIRRVWPKGVVVTEVERDLSLSGDNVVRGAVTIDLGDGQPPLSLPGADRDDAVSYLRALSSIL